MKSNILLLGPTGTGKTTSLKTLFPHFKQVRILACEPGIEAIMGQEPHEKVTWHYVPPANPSWDTMLDNARKINLLNFEGLSKLQGLNKSDYNQFIQVLESLSNFPDDRNDGFKLGAVDDWGEDVCFAIDGLTGLSTMALDLVVGGKPTRAQGEWGVAMDLIDRLVGKLTANTKCSFVLIAHMARERDELTGGTNLTVHTLGVKLAPKLPPKFDEVVLAVREGTSFSWSTAALNVDLKSRRLPIRDGLKADFGQIFGAK